MANRSEACSLALFLRCCFGCGWLQSSGKRINVPYMRHGVPPSAKAVRVLTLSVCRRIIKKLAHWAAHTAHTAHTHTHA